MAAQLDLFRDSRDVIAENELREAIRSRDPENAGSCLDELAQCNPGHEKLGAAEVLVEALNTAHPHGTEAVTAYLDSLEQKWTAKAGTFLGAEAGPERAFDLVKQLVSSDKEQLALRQELRDIHPGLFSYFLQKISFYSAFGA